MYFSTLLYKYANIITEMKRKIFALLLTTIALTGCKSIKNESAYKAINNYEHQVIEINAQSLKYMIEQKMSFPVLLYTEQCSFCERAKNNVSKLSKELNYAFYQIEIYSQNKQYLVNELPSYFKMDDTYPSLCILNSGNISYKSKAVDVINYSPFKRIINAYHLESKITTLTNFESFKDYRNEKEDFLLFSYDSHSSEDKMIYSNLIYPLASKSNKNTLIIDERTVNSAFFDEIDDSYNSNFSSLTVYENGQIKTTLDYAVQDGQAVKELIFSFFEVDSINSAS